MEFFKSIWQNKVMLLNLIRHDFKNRYLGNHLGIIWAFIQPVVMIAVYWFVFTKGLKAGTVDKNVPFLPWFMAGLIPWFFISDAIMSCSSAITSQSFLVKKIVFNVKLLPVVKIGSALIVSLIFWSLLLICLLCYGFYPDINWFGILYFLICSLALILSLGLILSSLTVFMPDVGQIVSIFIQVMFWATPIMWNKNMLEGKLKLITLLNPFSYIVDGIRESVIYDIPFWGHYKNGLYFWILTTILFVIGNSIFNKLRPHFADVL